MPLPAEAVSG